jgi:hypothetical protein
VTILSELALGLPSPSQRGKGVLEVLMIVYVHWKLIPVLQVRQPVFNGGVGCGSLGRETERVRGRVREREKERARALLNKKNTTMGQSNHCQRTRRRGWTKGGGGHNTFLQVNGCSRSIKGARTTSREHEQQCLRKIFSHPIFEPFRNRHDHLAIA